MALPVSCMPTFGPYDPSPLPPATRVHMINDIKAQLSQKQKQHD